MKICDWCGKEIRKRDIFQVELKHKAVCSSKPEDLHLHGPCFSHLMEHLRNKIEKVNNVN